MVYQGFDKAFIDAKNSEWDLIQLVQDLQSKIYDVGERVGGNTSLDVAPLLHH